MIICFIPVVELPPAPLFLCLFCLPLSLSLSVLLFPSCLHSQIVFIYFSFLFIYFLNEGLLCSFDWPVTLNPSASTSWGNWEAKQTIFFIEKTEKKGAWFLSNSCSWISKCLLWCPLSLSPHTLHHFLAHTQTQAFFLSPLSVCLFLSHTVR